MKKIQHAKVLVVEDELSLILLYEKRLEMMVEKLELHKFPDVPSAVHFWGLNSDGIDVIILDGQIGGDSGVELAKQFHAGRNSYEGMFLMSGNENCIAAARNLGMKAYEKPDGSADFYKDLRNYLLELEKARAPGESRFT